MLRALVLVVCLTATVAAQAHCYVGQYDWQPDDDGHGWYVDVDTVAATPVLLELQDMAVGPPDANRCVSAAHADYIVLAWDRVPFAQYPVPCGRHTLYFGVSTLGADMWGTDARSPSDGTLFAPQMGRADMLTGTASAATDPIQYRRLRMWTVSGAVRAPVEPLTVHVCVGERPVDVDARLRPIEAPRLLPVADCVHAFGGHCGTNLGWINSGNDAIELAPHTNDNRLTPTYVENGWHLPSSFAPGSHAPSSLAPHMHVGWPCDRGTVDGLEVHWHLDGRTLRLTPTTRRCTAEVAAPGHTLVWGETPAEREGARVKAAQAAADGDARLIGGPAEQSERPHVAQVAHETAVEGWRKAGVAFPYMSRINAEAHAAANVAAVNHHGARDDCVDNGCCGDECDWWWIWLIFIGAFLLFVLVAVFVALWWCEPDGWYWLPHPHAPHAMHPYESPAEYERIHGREAPMTVPAST